MKFIVPRRNLHLLQNRIKYVLSRLHSYYVQVAQNMKHKNHNDEITVSLEHTSSLPTNKYAINTTNCLYQRYISCEVRFIYIYIHLTLIIFWTRQKQTPQHNYLHNLHYIQIMCKQQQPSIVSRHFTSSQQNQSHR